MQTRNNLIGDFEHLFLDLLSDPTAKSSNI